MVDRIRTFFVQSHRLSIRERASNMALAETVGPASAPNQPTTHSTILAGSHLLAIHADSHASGERKAISIFVSLPESSAPLIVFLFALGIAFGAYVLLPLFLPHKLPLSPEDRLTVAAGGPLL